MLTLGRWQSSLLAIAAAALTAVALTVVDPASSAESSDQDNTDDRVAESTFVYPPLPNGFSPLVYGGHDAVNPGWITALFRDGSFICTASLIDPQVVLTAAHCVDDPDNTPGTYNVTIGAEYLYAQDIRRTVTQIYIHPGWGGRFNDTDLALLALDYPVTSVPVARLNSTAVWPEFAQPLTVAGWGRYYEGSGAAQYLQAGDVYATSGINGPSDPLYCALGTAAMGEGGVFCYGGPVDVSACRGDSGGPIMGWSTPAASSGDIVVYGVVAYGPTDCGELFDDIAQSVGGNYDWIMSVVDSIAGPPDPPDAVDVVILGGEIAVSASVEAQLKTCITGSVARLAGGNRYQTAAAISQATFSSADGAYIATGFNFPDALAGGPPAALNSQPVLLVNDAVPASTLAELGRLGVSSVTVLGGPAVVPESVVASLNSLVPTTRIAGSDRYSTAAAIVQAKFATASTVYVATGLNFPDALAGVPAAAGDAAPILLVQQNAIPGATAAQLSRLKPTTIKILGGEAVISAGVAASLGSYASNVIRLSGSDRYVTAAAISKHAFPSGAAKIYIATGLNYPDALAGGPAAGVNDAPILLVQTDAIPASTALEIQRITGTACG
jgi:putative cell wall-binding protein